MRRGAAPLFSPSKGNGDGAQHRGQVREAGEGRGGHLRQGVQGAGQGHGPARRPQEDPPRDGRGGHPAHRAPRDLPPQPPLPLHLRRPPPRRRAGRQERQARPLPRLRVPRHRPQEVPRRLPQGTQPQAATAAPSQGNQLTILTHRNSDHFSFFFHLVLLLKKNAQFNSINCKNDTLSTDSPVDLSKIGHLVVRDSELSNLCS